MAKKKRSFFKRLFRTAFLLLFLGAGLIAAFYYSVSWGFFGELYSKKEIADFRNEQASVIYSSDQQIIGKYFSVNRTSVPFDEIPSYLIDALIATEDARYFEHEGVDSRSLLRVLVKSILLNDKSAGGGSTITQQLAKNMYGRKRHGLLTMPVNKCKEIILAHRIESIYNKKEILALYLNTIPFGENVYGIESAAKRFFNRSVSELKIEEAAVLVGMLKANSYYNPRLHPAHSLTRRSVVFAQLFHYNYINQQQLDSLNNLPLVLDYANFSAEGKANYFLVRTKKEALEILEKIEKESGKEFDLEKDGLQIRTTLNLDLQNAALAAFKKHLKKMQSLLDKQYNEAGSNSVLSQLADKKRAEINQSSDSLKKVSLFSWNGYYTDSISVLDSLKHELSLLQAGLLAINPQSGAVTSWVGGIDFRTQPYDQIVAKRQMASTFKPLLYAAAIENGKRPCDYLDNSDFTLSDHEDWSPENYDQTKGGKYSLAAALANSKNIPTVRLYFETGFEKVDYLWKKMGFSSTLENKPSVALGTVTASLLEVAIAYASFANGGYKVEPYCIESITSSDGTLIYQKNNVALDNRILDEKTTVLLNEILQKAVREGTGLPIRARFGIQFPLAGKTGTSQSFSDAWFVSYNPGLVLLSRVGANSPTIHFNSGTYGSGGRLALPLVGLTLSEAQKSNALKKLCGTKFNALPKEFETAFDCDDFKPDNKLNQFFDQFRKKETTLEKEQKRAKRKKWNPFKKKD